MHDDLTPYQRAVATVVAGLGPGEVATYGEVATEAGYPGAARAVAGVLKLVPGLPWWRVTRSSGRLVSHLAREQASLLRAEGVTVKDGRVGSTGA